MGRGGTTRVALVAAVATAAVATFLVPAHAGSSPGLVRRLNQARIEEGLLPVQKDPTLRSAARRHSKHMVRTHRLEQPPSAKVPYPDHSYAAHVAVASSASKVSRILIRGDERRASVLEPRWTAVGVGMARDHRGRWWGTLVVADPEAAEWEVRATRPEPPPPPPGVMIPASIPSDCSRDVTADINAWIASVPDGSTLIFRRHGCYRTERTIEIKNRQGLTFFGNGAYFKRFELSPPEVRYPRANAHWRFVGGSDMTVLWMGVEGTNTVADQRPEFGSYLVDFEFEHAFAFHGVTHLTVDNVWADAIWGDGLYFAGGDQYAQGPCRGVRVSTFVVDRNGRQGVALSNVDGALLSSVEIWHSRRAGFDLEPPPGTVRNVEIRDSYTNTIGLAFASAGRGDVSNIEIHHNRIDGPSVPWVYVKDSWGARRSNWSVHDNVVLRGLGSPMAMLYFVNVDDVDVRRNTSHAATTQSRKAVEFQGAGGTLAVIANDFTGACSAYVKDGATGPVTAEGNTVSSC
jgi:hypothetical protein